MITIGTARFDFKADREPFAYSLYGHWDTFFHTAFETVVEEVMTAYDRLDSVLTIDHLPLDLGRIDEEDFDREFPSRLREALESYCREKLGSSLPAAPGDGITLVSAGSNAFRLLSFFLLHGYFPFATAATDMNLSLLLKRVMEEEASRFREFLNAYGHYDFLCRRLVFQFTDEELEQIVRVVQPSESIFIILYVRVQIHAYESLEHSELARDNYREAVWTLVLAYLFTEGAGYFSRKHIVLYTLRGLAAHSNLTLAEMIRILTKSIRELERTVELLPELWAILKEIRGDMKTALWTLDGDVHTRYMHEIVFTLRHEEDAETDYILSREHLIGLLSGQSLCRALLQQLREKEIHRLVAALVPQEKEYVISYASTLDKHKDAGTFSGRAGSEFRLLKWEFIFGVLVAMPVPAFNRKQFVLSVLHKLAAHYNFSVAELIHLLYTDESLIGAALSPGLLSVLQELHRFYHPVEEGDGTETYSTEDWRAMLQTPLLVHRYVVTHTERQVVSLVSRLFPAHSEFIVSYAALLDKGHERGMLQGKAGSGFSALKWEFILSCIVIDNGVAFHRKLFVYSVLQRMAAHYNQEVAELISYFLHHLPGVASSGVFIGLKTILEELYGENMGSPAEVAKLRSKSDEEVKHRIVYVLGSSSPLPPAGKEEYIEKWLAFILNERGRLFRTLWKGGKLNVALILKIVTRSASLRRLWLQKIGDERLAAIYRDWTAVYVALCRRFPGLGYVELLAEYITRWMVELTADAYAAWSETELGRFLAARIRQHIPAGYKMLLEDIPWEKSVTKIIKFINESNEKGVIMEQITVNNAGMLLVHPFLPLLFQQAGYLNETKPGFKDPASQVRAIFLLQYLVYGEEKEYPETELFLNKIIVDKQPGSPLPRRCPLTGEETELVHSLMDGLRRIWSHVQHTSDAGIRQSFFQREGMISREGENPVRWKVKVKDRAYDILLDNIPWSLNLVRISWAKYLIEINWRK